MIHTISLTRGEVSSDGRGRERERKNEGLDVIRTARANLPPFFPAAANSSIIQSLPASPVGASLLLCSGHPSLVFKSCRPLRRIRSAVFSNLRISDYSVFGETAPRVLPALNALCSYLAIETCFSINGYLRLVSRTQSTRRSRCGFPGDDKRLRRHHRISRDAMPPPLGTMANFPSLFY